MRTCKILLISIISAIAMFIISINFVFKIPASPGYEDDAMLITSAVGVALALIVALVAVLISNKLLPRTNKSDLENKLKDLSSMRKNGTITQDEYEAKRKQLIERY